LKTIEKAATKSRVKTKHVGSSTINSVRPEPVEGFTKLGNVVDSRVSQAGPQGGNDFVYVDIGSIDNEKKLIESPKTLSVDEAPSRAKQLLEVGDVVVSMTRPNLNAIAQITSELASSIGSTGFDVLRANRQLVAPTWIYYNLQTSRFIEEMCALVQGALYPAVRSKDIRNFEIWLPPLPAQHRIVAEIEEKLSRLDAAQSALLRAQANLKRYRASALKQTYGLNHNSSELPEGWEWTTIGKQFRVEVGATPSRKEATYWNGEIPWVSSGEVQFCRVHETTETITQLGYQSSSTKLNPIGSVLLAMIGQGKTRGQAAILEIEAANNQNCAAIWVGKTQTPPEFVYYWFMLQYDETRRIGSGNNQQALNKSLVQALALPWPPLETQKKIVEEVERRLSVIDRTEQTLRTQLERAKRLRQSILQQAFSPTRQDA
jgi:type I restriction enzyme, S subunit